MSALWNAVRDAADLQVLPADGPLLSHADGWRIARSIRPEGPNCMYLWYKEAVK